MCSQGENGSRHLQSNCQVSLCSTRTVTGEVFLFRNINIDHSNSSESIVITFNADHTLKLMWICIVINYVHIGTTQEFKTSQRFILRFCFAFCWGPKTLCLIVFFVGFGIAKTTSPMPSSAIITQRHNFALPIPTCWYLKTLKSCITPNANFKICVNPNIGCVGIQRQSSCVGHVHFMLFVSILFALW